jgi:hypothetical protein
MLWLSASQSVLLRGSGHAFDRRAVFRVASTGWLAAALRRCYDAPAMWCLRLATWGLALLLGCSAVEGPLLHARDASAPPDVGAEDAGRSEGLIAQDAAWQYQLMGTVDPAIDAELFVIDHEEEPSLIADLHARGKVVLAYVSAGTYEPYRDDADQFPEAARGNPLAAYPQEEWLDVRDATVRALMAARLQAARDGGFDGVLLTSLTAYSSDSGFALTEVDQDDYTRWLTGEARRLGLQAGMADGFGRSDVLAASFDFAIAFGCIERADCARLDPFAAQGKPVFDIETEGTAAEVCPLAVEYGVNALLKPSDFGAYRVPCP